ncbi:MAG TPA: hypothetical protein VKH64_08950 [Candidatus Binatia bacterium]|nr:hypothetical protein [Candidatus Binatia bacterium]
MKNFWTAFGLMGPLLFSPVSADELTKQDLLHTIRPPAERLSLVRAARVVDDDKVLGIVTMYDDPATERPVDYMEIYDTAGNLLAFGWFDQFGIERIAVDRSFVEPSQRPAGRFLIFADGQQL